MDYEKGGKEAREDVVAVLDGTDEDRREQLAQIAVWAAGTGRRIARANGQAPAKGRAIGAADAELDDVGTERAGVLAAMLRQVRAAA